MLQELPSSELLAKCLSGQTSADWQEFVRRFHPVIAASVSRVTRQYGLYSPELTDDLVQEVYLRICEDRCRLLREFRSLHPEALFPYLRVIATNLSHDSCKAKLSLKGGARKVIDIGGVSEESLPASEASSAAQDFRLLVLEIDEVLSREAKGEMAARDKNIFWLYYRQGWSSRDISLIPSLGLTQKGVESVLQRLVKVVRVYLTNPTAKGSGL